MCEVAEISISLEGEGQYQGQKNQVLGQENFFINKMKEDTYRFYTWTATYGTISPLGVPQQVILINGQFPGPRLDVVTNDNIILNLINNLDQPFLLTSGRTHGIGKMEYWGPIVQFLPTQTTHTRSKPKIRLPIPYPVPAGDFTLLIGVWYKTNHKVLRQFLDSGIALPFPDSLLINGQTSSFFSGDQEKTYMFRISNAGLSTSINFRIQDHKMKLVEYQPPKDYYIIASTRFTKPILNSTAVLHYTNSHTAASGPLPIGPTYELQWSMKQARTFRRNLTANAARLNPRGSFPYGSIKPSKTIILSNTAALINGKQRYAVNSICYVNADTPLKLADYFSFPGVFSMGIPSVPTGDPAFLATSVMPASFREFIEVVFQNNEREIQSWQLDGYAFRVVGYGSKQWSPAERKIYNLVDAVARHTVQVYPNSWTTVLVSLDNQGLEIWLTNMAFLRTLSSVGKPRDGTLSEVNWLTVMYSLYFGHKGVTAGIKKLNIMWSLDPWLELISLEIFDISECLDSCVLKNLIWLITNLNNEPGKFQPLCAPLWQIQRLVILQAIGIWLSPNLTNQRTSTSTAILLTHI
ncbi:Multicopper oxidase [Macleaya cordata]|uniref:Multicopper oxidase n=1 Tax=Macleaya cordata TaxID=56857 RepID=A0A200Q9Z4_MACCD|nr:Multicopper oxidase [Macleaya cordata]